jgi:hypothetical protein
VLRSTTPYQEAVISVMASVVPLVVTGDVTLSRSHNSYTPFAVALHAAVLLNVALSIGLQVLPCASSA